jgi:NAD(P)H-hydrate epimerase
MPVPGQCVITPHPGEAARLLKTTTDRINADRVSAAQQLHDLARAVVVLKGAGTLVATDADIRLCDQGNPGMASGGMGDVLSGVIAALVAQGLAPEIAAQLAVVVHAKAADKLAAQHGERGLLASDLIPVMRSLLNAA